MGDHFPEKVAYNKLNEQQKEIIDNFKGATLVSLTKSMIDMSVEGEENLLKFKTTFIVFIHKCFLLPTTGRNGLENEEEACKNGRNTRN
ncbi:hypothetical protein AHAS_Ahas10G0114400 [Arachis hypogaea]